MPEHCGKEWPENALFCRICGKTLRGAADDANVEPPERPPVEQPATPVERPTQPAAVAAAQPVATRERRCERCGTVERGDERLCRQCGGKLALPAYLAQAKAAAGPACGNCGVTMTAGDLFCGSCGARATHTESSAATRTAAFCPNCGVAAAAGGSFCASCGFSLGGAAPRQRYAGVWKRIGSSLIDVLITAALAAIPAIIVGVIVYQAVYPDSSFVTEQQSSDATAGSFWAGFGVYYAISAVYYVVGWSRGRTWGMMALDLRMIRASDGERPGVGPAIGRYLVSLISGWFFYLGYLWAIWDNQNQTWHDKAAGTIVVEE